MSDLVECIVDGGTWVFGDLVVSRREFEQMRQDVRGEFTAAIRNDGYMYYYDQLRPEFNHPDENLYTEVRFSLSPKNVVMKIPA
jgi:hypothetical protein